MFTNTHTYTGSIHSGGSGFTAGPRGSARPARPAQLDPAVINQIEGGADPQKISEMSHTSAAVLLNRVHHTQNPEIVERVLTIVENEGVEIIADLWSKSDAETLPGMLWRLYMLRMSLRNHSEIYAQYWRLGEPLTTSASAIAGISNLPTGDDIVSLADSILSGAFIGDFAVALERSSAFTSIIAEGMRHAAHSINKQSATANTKTARLLHNAANLNALSTLFRRGATLWRTGKLE